MILYLLLKLSKASLLFIFFQDEDDQGQPGDTFSAAQAQQGQPGDTLSDVPMLTIGLKDVGNKFNLQVV